jgi:SAM-dependent methyltransferase
MEPSQPWQLALYEKSLKKKEKVALLDALIRRGAHRRCLEIGCARGTISYFLRKRGGRWTHVDLDFANVAGARSLLGDGVAQFGPEGLPFRDAAFDGLVVLDYLEHVHDDERCLDEVDRVLEPGGTLYLSTPTEGGFLNWLKPRIGLTLDRYGHVREGYRLADLEQRLARRGYRVLDTSTYSFFFTEALEMAINAAFVFLGRKKKASAAVGPSRDGHIAPSSEAEFRKKAKQLKLYSLIYPVFRAVALLDRLCPPTSGYALVLRAIRNQPNAPTSPTPTSS